MAVFQTRTAAALDAARKRLAQAEQALAAARERFDLACRGAALMPAAEGEDTRARDPALSEEALRAAAREARQHVFDAETDLAVAGRAVEIAEGNHADYLAARQAELRQSHVKSFEQHAARLKKEIAFLFQKLGDVRTAVDAANRAYASCLDPLRKCREIIPGEIAGEIALADRWFPRCLAADPLAPQTLDSAIAGGIEHPAPMPADVLAAIDRDVARLRELMAALPAETELAEVEEGNG